MQTSQNIDYQKQIDEAMKRAKCKKVLYLYDEYWNRQLLGVFSKSKAAQIKKYLRQKKLIDRLAEFDILTTEPDSDFKYK